LEGGQQGERNMSRKYRPETLIPFACSLLFVSILCRPCAAQERLRFASPEYLVAGSDPQTLITADFNSDGKLDLAVVTPKAIAILMNNGDGTFQTATYSSAGNGIVGLAAADFNGDGKLDLAVANQGTHLEQKSGSVSILLGNGDGTFYQTTYLATVATPAAIQAADLNGDGKADIIVSGFGTAFGGGALASLLGNGDGTFQSPIFFSAGDAVFDIYVADLNRDGKPDLLVRNYNAPAVLLGNGDGTFQSPAFFSAGNLPVSFAIGDFNGDGLLDIADVCDAENGSISVLLGNGDGSFQPPKYRYFLSPQEPWAVVTADFNGDGILDLAVTSQLVTNSLHIFLGKGDGTFGIGLPIDVNAQTFDTVTGDFDGDGKPDWAFIVGFRSVGVLLNATQ